MYNENIRKAKRDLRPFLCGRSGRLFLFDEALELRFVKYEALVVADDQERQSELSAFNDRFEFRALLTDRQVFFEKSQR